MHNGHQPDIRAGAGHGAAAGRTLELLALDDPQPSRAIARQAVARTRQCTVAATKSLRRRPPGMSGPGATFSPSSC